MTVTVPVSYVKLFEGLIGESCPPDLAEAVRSGAPALPWHAHWTAPDATAHRQAAEHCLAAIADGEVYRPACAVASRGCSPATLCSGVRSGTPARAAWLAQDTMTAHMLRLVW